MALHKPLGRMTQTSAALRTRLLWQLDRLFPPDPTARMAADEQTEHEVLKASGSMGRYLNALHRTDVDVLDFGCGWGGETLWLAERVRSVAGVDVEAHSVEQARNALAASGRTNCRFERSVDGRLPFPDASFDAVFSTDVFEHVMDLDQAFHEIFRVLRPGGRLLSRFGPLFRSPQGYHLYWVCQVPWAHLLFGLEPMLALRHARSGGEPFEARDWGDMGLNGKRAADFLRAMRHAGFEMTRAEIVPVRGLTRLARLPVVGDLVIFGIDCDLRRPA